MCMYVFVYVCMYVLEFFFSYKVCNCQGFFDNFLKKLSEIMKQNHCQIEQAVWRPSLFAVKI